MPGIPPDLDQRLREVLARCGPFESDAALRAVFTTELLYAWRDRIPDNTPNRATRVAALIDGLHNQNDADGNNVLVLFLYTLVEQTPQSDVCYRDFGQLIADLEPLAPYLSAETVQQPGESPYKGLLYFTEDDADNFCVRCGGCPRGLVEQLRQGFQPRFSWRHGGLRFGFGCDVGHFLSFRYGISDWTEIMNWD